MSEAQAKANEKYRKANVKSFNVKFFPADADVLAYFQAKKNRNQVHQGPHPQRYGTFNDRPAR